MSTVPIAYCVPNVYDICFIYEVCYAAVYVIVNMTF
jgi:hypothetical protein